MDVASEAAGALPTLYHVNAAPLEPGDLVRPGMWGTPIIRIGHPHNAAMREHLLDFARKMVGAVVSRFECVFAFERLDDARHLRDTQRQPLGAFIYEVTATGGDYHRADMAWTDLAHLCPPGASPDDVERHSRAYWEGVSVATTKGLPAVPEQWEWLLPEPVRVVAKVE